MFSLSFLDQVGNRAYKATKSKTNTGTTALERSNLTLPSDIKNSGDRKESHRKNTDNWCAYNASLLHIDELQEHLPKYKTV